MQLSAHKPVEAAEALSAIDLVHVSQDELCERAVELIASSVQHPEAACVRISLNGQDYLSPEFIDTQWKIAAPVNVRGEQVGQAELCYREEKPEGDEGPFLRLERMLLNIAASVLSDAAQVKRSLTEYENLITYSENIVATVREPLLVLDSDLRVVSSNRAFYQKFKAKPEETEGLRVQELGRGQWNIPELLELLHAVLTERQIFEDFELEHDFPAIGKRVMHLNARGISYQEEAPELILLAIEDVTDRKRYMRGLKSFAENVVENVPAFVIGVQKDGGQIKRVNRYAERIIGYSEKELQGFDWVEQLIKQEDKEKVRQAMGKVLNGEIVERMPANLVAKDGSTLPTSLYGSPLYGKEEEAAEEIFGTLVIGLDVAELQRREEELRQAFEQMEVSVKQRTQELEILANRLKEAQHLARMGTWEYIMETGELYWSEEMFRLLKLNPEDYTPTYERFLEMTHPDDRLAMKADVEKAIHNNTPYDTVHRVVLSDNTIRTVRQRGGVKYDEAGNARSMLGSMQDITEQKQMEERLRESERLFRRLFDESPVGVGIVGTDFRLHEINEAYCHILGYKREELIGKSLAEFTHPDDIEKDRQDIERMISGEQDIYAVEKRYIRKDGRIATVYVHAKPIRDSEGKTQFMLPVILDVTEQRHLQDQLLHASRMEAIGRLAGGVAHDFNNYLTAIKGYSELLLAEAEADDSKDYIEQILKSANHAALLTRQLLAFGRQTAVKREVINLNAIVVETAKTLSQLLREDMKLVIEEGSNLANTHADRGQIRQVILNLVVNSIDAMPMGGTLTISTRNAEVNEQQAGEIPDARPGKYVELTVSDTGIGIDPDVLPHIFEPFYTTKRTREGSGLGLSTVYGIVAQSGGFATVESALGEGANFHVFLPVTDAGQRETIEEEKKPYCPGGQEKVLVVEDEESVRIYITRVLENYGFIVQQASCPMEAIRIAKEDPDFQLLLSDIVMPEMNGLELAKQLRNRTPDLPALFVSGYTKDAIPNRDIAEADIDLLTKPFEMDELCNRARKAIDRMRATKAMMGSGLDRRQ